MQGQTADTVEGFIKAVEEVRDEWETDQYPWFRGEPAGKKCNALRPKLFRDCYDFDENWLLQFFRMRAPVTDLPITPDRGEIDKWLFLARHMGLPTRLLDWTEGALVALYFALQEIDDEQDRDAKDEEGCECQTETRGPPVVWMLNPLVLNLASAGDATENQPHITWSPGTSLKKFEVKEASEDRGVGYVQDVAPQPIPNIGFANIKQAWSLPEAEYARKYPVATYPTIIHPLMSAQMSCFTIHGEEEKGLFDLCGEIETAAKEKVEETAEEKGKEVGDAPQEFEGRLLTKFVVEINKVEGLSKLRRLGVSQSGLFPSGRGLAKELEWLDKIS